MFLALVISKMMVMKYLSSTSKYKFCISHHALNVSKEVKKSWSECTNPQERFSVSRLSVYSKGELVSAENFGLKATVASILLLEWGKMADFILDLLCILATGNLLELD